MPTNIQQTLAADSTSVESTTRNPVSGFALALALSGFAALAYQTTWQRVLTQIIGSDAISATLIVTIFMICLGVGSALARRIVTGSIKQAVRVYAMIEVLVGLYGLFSIPLLRGANERLASVYGDSVGLDFMTNLILLSVPVIGMGLTTPLIVHVAKHRLDDLGRVVGRLYSWNIAGAAIGAAVTGLVLIEGLGLQGTTWLAAALNILAAAFAVLAFRKLEIGSYSVAPSAQISTPTPIPVTAAISAIMFGFGTLAIQAIFFRMLSNYMTLSPIVFPMVLSAYLTLMSVGQRVGGELADRYSGQLHNVIIGLFTVGAMLFIAALHLPHSWAAAMGALRFSSFNGQLVASDYPHLIGDPSPMTVLSFSLFLMLSVLAWSGLFPVMLKWVTRRVDDAGDQFAAIYTLYTTGNVIGIFACGIFMLPALGTGHSAMVTVLVVGVGVLVLLVAGRRKVINAKPLKSGLAVTAGLCAAFLAPIDYYRSFHLGAYSVIDAFEGRNGVATVVPTSRFYTIVDMNRTASASAIKVDPQVSDQYQAWRWNHSELMAIEPAFRPKKILVIGIGHAYLIDAMLDYPFVEKIVVVDISAEVINAVKKYTLTSTKRIFSDPRVEIIVADGRRYVQSAIKNGQKFDLIQNKINEPWHAGSSNLFTREFFREERSLLTDGGYLSTRPLTGHLTDGFAVFGNAIWGGYYHLYFKNGSVTSPDTARITPDIRTAWFAELPGRDANNSNARATTAITIFKDLPAEFQSDANTDDRPTFEYYWLRQLLGVWQSPRAQLSDIDVKKYTTDVPVQYD